MPGGRPRLPDHLRRIPLTVWVRPDAYDRAYLVARRRGLSMNRLFSRTLEHVFRTTQSSTGAIVLGSEMRGDL